MSETPVVFPMRLQALQAALDFVDQGFTLYGLDLRLIAWNKSFLRLLDFPPEMAYVGAPFTSFIRYNAQRGDYGPGDVQAMVDERVRRGGLVEILQGFSAEGPTIHALMSHARASSANARAFVAFLVDVLARPGVSQA